MNRPLVSVALAYAAGLLVAQLVAAPLPALIAVGFLLLALVLALEKYRRILIWPLLALAGWGNFTVQTAALAPDDLRTVLGGRSVLAHVRGTLLETPSLRIYVRDGERVERMMAALRVTAVQTNSEWQAASGDIIATVPGILGDTFFTGQRVEVSGVLARPDRPVAEGIFDYRSYLEKLGIFYTLKTGSPDDWRPGENPVMTPPYSARFIRWAQQTLSRGLDPEDESTQLLLAMTLGQKTALNDEVSEPFMKSGTMHIFAISGLHIALIAGILLALLRVLRMPRPACGLVVLPLIWFYTAATGWQPSAIRSTIMMSVIITGWMLKRPSSLLNSLAAAGLIILIWDPQQLFQASFQLSFFVVLSIALFSPPLEKIRDHFLEPDKMQLRESRPRWRQWLDAPLRWLAASLTTSLAAWLGSLPLTAYYFHIFSPVTLLANLFIVPLSGFALMANLGGIIFGPWLPWVTELFNNAAWLFMWLMVWLSEASTKLPGSWVNIPAPSLPVIAAYFALLIGITSGWLLVESRRKFLIALLVLLAVAGIGCWQWSRADIQATVLPLSGGHAVYVDADGRKNDWLINCGNKNAVELTLKDYLRAQGVNHLPRLILTEGAIRNCGGARSLDEITGIGEVWTSEVKFRSPAYRDAVAYFEKSARHRRLKAGDQAGPWRVLFPLTNSPAKADDCPLVLMGDLHGAKILLLSDLSRAGQNELLNHTNDLRANIVVAGLPTEGEPLCDALIDAIQPAVIVVADSERPAPRRASSALKDRLAQPKIPVFYTRQSGAVTIIARPGGWELTTMSGETVRRP